MSTEREDLIEEANGLDIEFKSNIPSVKLKELIDAAKSPDSTEQSTTGAADTEKTESATEALENAMAADVPEQPDMLAPLSKSKNVKDGSAKPLTLREKIVIAKKRALTKHVVTITNKDNRENDVMTTVPLSFENQYFGLARDVPLDIPVELEQALIEVAEGASITLHKAEILNGRPTGNRIPVATKKFAVSYGKPVE